MPTEQIQISCTNNEIGTDNVCTLNFSDVWNGNVDSFNTPFFSAGDMMISFLLLLIFLSSLISYIIKIVSSVDVFKKYQGVNQQEGKENYKI